MELNQNTTHYSPIGLFRKGLTSNDRLKQTFVGREHILEELLEHLGKRKKSNQHFLFIGPRGIGKTHLMTMLALHIKESEDLKETFEVLHFPEENNRILSFADFLLGILELLSEQVEDHRLKNLYEKLSINDNDKEVTETVLACLKQYHKKSHKKLLILLENIDTMFHQQIKKKTCIHELRHFLMDHSIATLIASAPSYFSGLYDTGQPFYDFFDIQTLEELSFDQTIAFIQKNFEYDQDMEMLEQFNVLRPKIKAMHVMTGGNPRLTLMLYELLSKNRITEVKQQFHILLDKISPFFQDRIKDLPPQERAILETIALMRGEEKRTPGNIAKKLRKSQQQTSSLLKRMTRAGYLIQIKNPDDKRSTMYRLKEGLFDLWLAMSQSRKQNKYLPFIVDFLEGWYSSGLEREQKRKELKEQLSCKESRNRYSSQKNLDEMLCYFTETGNFNEKIQTKIDVIYSRLKLEDLKGANNMLGELKQYPTQNPLYSWMQDNSQQLLSGQQETGLVKQFENIISLWENQRTGQLEQVALLAKKLSIQFTEKGLHQLNIAMLEEALSHPHTPEDQLNLINKMADSFIIDGQYQKAQNTLEQALKIAEKGELNEKKAPLLNRIAMSYLYRGEYEQAKKYLEKSLTLCKKSGNKKLEASILNNFSQISSARGQYDQSMKYLKKSLKIRKEVQDITGEVATLNNLSTVYVFSEKYSEAEENLKQSLKITRDIGDKSNEASILNNLSQVYRAKNDQEKAMNILEQALVISKEIGNKYDEGTILHSLSEIHYSLGHIPDSKELLLKSLEIRHEIGDQPGLSMALFNLGYIHLDEKNTQEAIKSFVASYQIALSIQENRTLCALDNLAKDLDKGGLQFWQDILDQIKEEEEGEKQSKT